MTNDNLPMRERLDRAEAVLAALQAEEVDAVVGRNSVALLRIRKVEEQLRQSEDRYRAIVEDQADLICRWKPDRTLTFVNGAFCRLARRSAAELIGRRFQWPVAAEDRERIEGHVATLNLQHPVASFEHRMEVEGETRWFQWTSHVIADRAGGVLEVQSVGRDVTEQKLVERQLRQANASLERRVAERTAQLGHAQMRERERLTRLLHDHLQQLLVAAKMRAEVALTQASEGGGGVSGSRFSGSGTSGGGASGGGGGAWGGRVAMAQSLEAVVKLLVDSLQVTRDLTAELDPPVLREPHLPTLLAWIAQRKHTQYGLRVTVEAADLRLENEPVRRVVFELVRELLFNVVKHAGVSQALVRAEPWGRNGMHLCVQDHGGGFDPATAGASVGLTSTRERVTALGGRVEIQSRPGAGTAVHLYLPLDGDRDAATTPG